MLLLALLLAGAVPVSTELSGPPLPRPRLPLEAHPPRDWAAGCALLSPRPEVAAALFEAAPDGPSVGQVCRAADVHARLQWRSEETCVKATGNLVVARTRPHENGQLSRWEPGSRDVFAALTVAVTAGLASPVTLDTFKPAGAVDCHPIGAATLEALREDCARGREAFFECLKTQRALFGPHDERVQHQLAAELARRSEQLREVALHPFVGQAPALADASTTDGWSTRFQLEASNAWGAPVPFPQACGGFDADGVPLSVSVFVPWGLEVLAPGQRVTLTVYAHSRESLLPPREPLFIGFGPGCRAGYVTLRAAQRSGEPGGPLGEVK